MSASQKEYKVVVGVGADALSKLVEAALADGWFLQGGVAMTSEDGYDILAQALTRGRYTS